MRSRVVPAILLLSIFIMAPLSGGGIAITAFSIDDGDGVVVDSADDTFSCIVTATGASVAGCVVKSPSSVPYSCFDATEDNDVFTCVVTIPAKAEAGTYTLRHVVASSESIKLIATAAEIATLPGDTTVTVTSANEDVTAPALFSFSALPEIIDPDIGDTVSCSAIAEDDSGSPHIAMSCTWKSPSGETRDSNGNPYGCASASEACSFTIPANSEEGYWLLDAVTLRDRAGNVATLDAADVGSVGGTTLITLSDSLPAGACTRTADLTATSGWDSSTAQTAASDAYINAWVRTSGQGSLFAIGNAAITNPANAAILVRFNSSGAIDAMNGSSYAALNTASYSNNVWYQISIHAKWETGTYDLFVSSCLGGDVMTTVAYGYEFQTGAPVAGGLTHYAVYGPAGIAANAADTMWLIFAPEPDCSVDTCGSRECGQPPNGCGGILASCGDCTGGETCGAITPYMCD